MIVQSHYDLKLFNSSLDYIEKIQDGASVASQTIWNLYSNIGVAAIVGLPPAIILLVFWDRLHSFMYVVMITALFFIMNVGKLWYWQARPFWAREEI